MKIYNKIIALFAIGIAMASCGVDISEEDYTPASKESDGLQAAYFTGSSYSRTVEVEPGSASFDITIGRLNTSSTANVGITVVNDENGIFDVPSTVSFAAGESTATLTINAPRAAEGVNYPLTIAIADADKSLYTNGYREVNIDFAILKWDNIGTGYLLDGTIGTFWGVDSSIPLAVDIQHTTTATGERFRFYSPFAHVATATDGIGYVGYPYNEEGDCDEADHLMVINITEKGAVLNPLAIGMDWGYGSISIGSQAYGNYDKDNGVIVFPANALYICMTDYNAGKHYDCGTPTYVYLSAESYLKSLGGDEEGEEEE